MFSIKSSFLFLLICTLIAAFKDSEDMEDLQEITGNENTTILPTATKNNNLLIYIRKDVNKTGNKVTKPSIVSGEQAFKNLLNNPKIAKVFKTHKNWHTWTNIKLANGNDKVKYYFCSPKAETIKSPHCEKGYWKQHNLVPSCAFNIFSMANGNEVCAHAFGDTIRTKKGSSFCEEGRKYKIAYIKEKCNHKLHAKWFFSKRMDKSLLYMIPELNILCKNQASCEIYTMYKINENSSKIVFKIKDKEKKPLYVKIMFANGTSDVWDGTNLSLQTKISKYEDDYQETNYTSLENITEKKEFMMTTKEVLFLQNDINNVNEDPPQNLENWMNDSVEYSTKKLILPWQYYKRPLL